MLQWLSEWIKEIILIIMLAVFIDLLLPSDKMQRYVKVVLSLFILMTILTPIVAFFNKDFNFESWDEALFEPSNKQSYRSLDEVLDAGAELRRQNDLKAGQLIETRMVELMKRDLDAILPGQIHQVEVKAEVNDQEVNLKKVLVTVMNEEQFIEPVQTVVINIELNHINEEHVFNDKGQASSYKSEQEERIFRILEQHWHISAEQLVITHADDMLSSEREVSSWASF